MKSVKALSILVVSLFILSSMMIAVEYSESVSDDPPARDISVDFISVNGTVSRTIPYTFKNTQTITCTPNLDEQTLECLGDNNKITISTTSNSDNYEFKGWIYLNEATVCTTEKFTFGKGFGDDRFTVCAYYRMKVDKNDGSFADLEEELENSNSIKLNKNYTKSEDEKSPITIEKDTVIDLNGFSIDGSNRYDSTQQSQFESVFYVCKGATLEIYNGIITGGKNCHNDGLSTSSYAGGIIVSDKSKAYLDNITVLGCTGVTGGGISAIGNSYCKVSNSKILFNYACMSNGQGGGIYVAGDDLDGSRIEIKNSIISNNVSSQRGGGISCDILGNVVINGGKITSNYVEQRTYEATGGGGGICLRRGGEVALTNVNIGGSPYEGNTVALGSGGGIFVYHDTNYTDEISVNKVTIRNCKISYNNSTDGAGIATLIDQSINCTFSVKN